MWEIFLQGHIWSTTGDALYPSADISLSMCSDLCNFLQIEKMKWVGAWMHSCLIKSKHFQIGTLHVDLEAEFLHAYEFKLIIKGSCDLVHLLLQLHLLKLKPDICSCLLCLLQTSKPKKEGHVVCMLSFFPNPRVFMTKLWLKSCVYLLLLYLHCW